MALREDMRICTRCARAVAAALLDSSLSGCCEMILRYVQRLYPAIQMAEPPPVPHPWAMDRRDVTHCTITQNSQRDSKQKTLKKKKCRLI
jgi:hypothetical protein